MHKASRELLRILQTDSALWTFWRPKSLTFISCSVDRAAFASGTHFALALGMNKSKSHYVLSRPKARPAPQGAKLKAGRCEILYLRLAVVLFAIAMLGGVPARAATLDLQTRVALQATLKAYIDAGTKDGVYQHYNVERGENDALRLKNLHPVIFRNGDKYLLCADFLEANGETVLLDFIVSDSAQGLRIEQEIRARRSYLKQFFERVM